VLWSKTASAVLKATAEAVALQLFSINVGLTIEPLAQPTVTALVIMFLVKSNWE
jgi:hypothetical protein